jgi:hypothetical protein
MKRTISEENTHLGAKLKFTRVVFAKARPTRASKNTEKRVIRSDVKKTFEWWHILKGPARHAINQIASGEKCFIPIT